MLDWPRFGDALWSVSDELGIRPEWQLPVLYFESGGTFDPSVANAIGCVGLNQFCPTAAGPSPYLPVPPAQYRAWAASDQLAGPIRAYWRDASRYGPIRSATRLELAQLGPALLARARSLGSTVYAAPSAEYAGNRGFDAAGKGYFTVFDVADAMARASAAPAVRTALARAYAMRPWERPSDPVFGNDWSTTRPIAPPRLSIPPSVFTAAAVGVLAAAAGFAALERHRFA
jgi:hypothetical protein